MAVPETPSLRERILTVLKSRYENIEAGVDGYTITWNRVVRRPLTETEQEAGDALAIIDSAEVKSAEVQHYRSTMTVFTEFWIKLMEGDDPSVRLNLALLDVQRTMLSDIGALETPGDPTTQLAVDITEVRNEFDIDSAADRLVGGIVQWEVIYRHSEDDPRVC